MLAGGSPWPFTHSHTCRCSAPRFCPVTPSRVGPVHAHARAGVQTQTPPHVHACDFPASPHHHRTICVQIPTRGAACATHVGPVPWGGPQVPTCGGSQQRALAWVGVFAPMPGSGLVPGILQLLGLCKGGSGEELDPCSCASRKEDIWVSLPPRHATTPCPGSSGPHHPWAGSALLLGRIAALPASQQARGTAGRSPLQGLPLQVPASPSVGEILASSCPRLG